ncbi:hypothetical protein F5Y08DRAFT_263046 [Xylaria arbuscula]|nr:hypothetical protein F5Y08DRAFT_263046 [Xylaria arbuscula]
MYLRTFICRYLLAACLQPCPCPCSIPRQYILSENKLCCKIQCSLDMLLSTVHDSMFEHCIYFQQGESSEWYANCTY